MATKKKQRVASGGRSGAKSGRKARASASRPSARKKKSTKKGARQSQRRLPAVAAGTINFIPNDPQAIAKLAMRKIAPRPNRTGATAKFAFENAPGAPAQHAPGTPEFLFWQSREAALAAVEAFEAAAGPIKAWSSQATQPLPLITDAGLDLNAYYDRASVSFFHSVPKAGPIFSGDSTDCVAHEVGHAILDSIRPDLWASSLPEHGAFHEAFGDCVAILTALNDPQTRTALLASGPNLGSANFVEAIVEDLANGVRLVYGPQNPSAQPRHALNNFQWQLPSSLPTTGGPAVLTGEVHSFARVFTGCFYDTIRNIFASFTTKTAATLATAARTAGGLLAAGARNAVESPRLFQAVGVAMLAADQNANAGANQAAITKAFAAHGIALATPARAFEERTRLAGGFVEGKRAAAVSLSAVKTELRRRIGAAGGGAQFREFPLRIADEKATKLVRDRAVDLAGLGKGLDGVVAYAPEPVLVAGVQTRYAAARSALPEVHTTEDEVRYFALTLLDHSQVETSRRKPVRSTSAVSRRSAVAGPQTGNVASSAQSAGRPTHVIREKGGKRVLTRVRFACGCSRNTER